VCCKFLAQSLIVNGVVQVFNVQIHALVNKSDYVSSATLTGRPNCHTWYLFILSALIWSCFLFSSARRSAFFWARPTKIFRPLISFSLRASTAASALKMNQSFQKSFDQASPTRTSGLPVRQTHSLQTQTPCSSRRPRP
jgi:hypothetical protein